jgi:two-component system chemotaxis sensor kinase CheA
MTQDLELLQAFLAESAEILGRMESDIAALRANAGDLNTVNSLFRAVHTIKGNSSFLDLTRVTALSHAAEALLDKVRNGGALPEGILPALLEQVLGDLRVMIEEQRFETDVSATIGLIEQILHGGAPALDLPAPAASVPTPEAAPRAAETAPEAAARVSTNFTRVGDDKIAKIFSVASELELLRYSLEQIPERMESAAPALADLRFDLELQVSKLSRLSRSLSSLIFGVRLVPVNQVFQRFPRVIQELGRKLGKEIKLQVINGDAELDKFIVEAIADPMTHLIRNAADHGIETAEERLLAGKPAQGTVRLNSYVRANFVYIEISDDGKGIDGDRVLAKAIEKGIVPPEKAGTFTEAQKLSLIFAPGFSTADQVTDISGRGVGMDVVKSNINQLKGTVILDSKVGKGTLIQLRFPMSMAVLFSLFLEVGPTKCAVPVEQIDESMDYFPGEIVRAVPEGEDASEYMALFSVRNLLWQDETDLGLQRRCFHTLRFKDDPSKAFIVEEFASIEEAVVQSVDSYIAALPGLQGATIRKDGSVALVLNPQAISEIASRALPIGYVKKHVRAAEEVSLASFLELA